MAKEKLYLVEYTDRIRITKSKSGIDSYPNRIYKIYTKESWKNMLILSIPIIGNFIAFMMFLISLTNIRGFDKGDEEILLDVKKTKRGETQFLH